MDKPLPIFRLRVLGGASLERSDGAPVVGRAAQRQRIALLALLATAPGQTLSRDKLLGVLWPESDGERARNLLNVAVYDLRKALGDAAILSTGDDLRLNPEVVSADVIDVVAAIAADDHERAVELHRGPFLDGFHLSDAPEVERWIDRERERLSGIYARSLESLAEDAERRHDYVAASERWKQRVAHDPLDSRVAMRYMRALVASGNRAGALQHASVHERLLDQELGVGMPAEVRGLVEQVRGEGLEVRDEGRGRGAEGGPAPSPVERSAPVLATAGPGAGARPVSRWRRRGVALAGVAALVAVGLAWAALRPASADPRDLSVAVLPFVDMSGGSSDEYLSDGVTEEIITRLSTVPSLKVISRTSVMRYKKTTKSLREIARELGVAHVLEGSVQRHGSKVRITAQLIDAGTDHHLWADSYDRDIVDIFQIRSDIAREVARALEINLTRDASGSASRGTRNPDAYELYLRGRHLWDKRTSEGHVQAIAYFQQAIEQDSTYADAYAGLADALFTTWMLRLTDSERDAEMFARVKAAAERAVFLDDRSAAARTSLAVARWWDADWTTAERELRRAIDLNPNFALARSWLSVLLSGMGRLEEGVRQAQRAYELDPFAVAISNNYATALYFARRYDDAIEQFRKTLEIEGRAWGVGHRGLGRALLMSGRHAEAVQSMRRAVAAPGDSLERSGDLAYALAIVGDTAEARRLLREMKSPAPRSLGHDLAFTIGRAHMALGERDSAFAWLERHDWRWPSRANIHDPTLDPLRSDPRFARMASRMGVR